MAKDAAVLANLLADMDDPPRQSGQVFGAEQMREVLADMAAHADFRAYLALEIWHWKMAVQSAASA